ncbi:hypothetical protein COCCADRAFT_105996 [Bipolaris zeicola 26-R-13]|uniref:Zn(2)-C6 fungal-type domain-containing protein n=1 Tax=Cochliobolus carbonum (strain 26-R-13) TaxID=930089 RepID=W6YEM3_COCC2|nr:uncharacterized protein COCCADRAFT_105996 [Bipolaris zeicola 26-R-13]EUC29636.1 hypothetical protein COCCADRAFT_105996 [Bipolaris zeicola 26-R-13]
MVYRGKPSAACAECRKLRSRCDKKQPACGQCIKAGRECSGYRNMVDLMFLDESSRVVTQNRGRISPRKMPVEDNHANEMLVQRPKKQELPESPFRLAGFVMYQPLDDLGVNFFMNNFIVDDPNMSLIHYLPSYYARSGFSGPALRQMCAAVGLVSLANKSHRKDMLSVATNNYATAIRVINAALLCPRKAAQDSILASIFMAAMFEALIIPRHVGMDNCCTHLAGAVSVAHLILKQERQTDVTIQQCTALVKTVIMNCWVQQISLPPNFSEFKNLVEKKAARMSVHDMFLNIVMELLQFKNQIQSPMQDDPTAIIRRALAIDSSLEDFARTLDRQTPFESVQLPAGESEHVAYKGYYHIYPQHLHAHLWNNVRSSRIRLHQLILRQSQGLMPTPELRTQEATSETVIVTLAMEMIASVPQLAGYLEDLETPTTPVIRTVPTPDSTSYELRYPTQRCAAARTPESNPHSFYHILYQLYIYGAESCLPQSMRHWIQQRIAWMENKANPVELVSLQDVVRRQLWNVSSKNSDKQFVEFVSEAESPASLAFDANACAIEKPAITGFRIGGNDFLHREAVSAGGMHSCSSIACSICNL